MSEINKIHVNNSTRVSLNDRFTAFSVRSASAKIKNTRNNFDSKFPPRSSEANRKLVQRLSVKHNKARITLKPQKTVLKGNLKFARRQQFTKAIIAKRPNLRSDLVKASRVPRTLKRSNSVGNLAPARNRNQVVANQQQRARSSSQSRGRSRTRNQSNGTPTRNINPRNINPRNINQRNINPRNINQRNINPRNINQRNINPRNNSQTRARSVSRTRKVNATNAEIIQKNTLRGRSASRNRQNKNLSNNRSIANRLGIKKVVTNPANKGRISRRAPVVGQANNSKAARQSRSRTRGIRVANQNNIRNKINNERKPLQKGRVDRSQGRRRSQSRKPNGKPQPGLKKEDLDQELDHYMASSKMT